MEEMRIEMLEAINKDLLKACKSVLHIDRPYFNDLEGWGEKEKSIMNSVRQAIAKAEGVEP
jgi:hypothetical protein